MVSPHLSAYSILLLPLKTWHQPVSGMVTLGWTNTLCLAMRPSLGTHAAILAWKCWWWSLITGFSPHLWREINFLCPVISLALRQGAEGKLAFNSWEGEAEVVCNGLNALFFQCPTLGRWALPQHCRPLTPGTSRLPGQHVRTPLS